MKLFNLGIDDPLTLAMAHPLAERVETLGNDTVKQSLSRSAASAIIIGGAFLSAPLTLASDTNLYPQSSEELAGKVPQDTQQTTSVYKLKTHVDDNGKQSGVEINSVNGVVQAYRIDENGVKTQMDPIEIESLKIKRSEDLDGIETLEDLEGLTVIFNAAEGNSNVSQEDIAARVLAEIQSNINGGGAGDSVTFNLKDNLEFSGNNAAYVDRLSKFEDEEIQEIIAGQVSFALLESNETQLESMLAAATSLVQNAQTNSAALSDSVGDLNSVKRELDKALKALEKAEKALREEQARKALEPQ